MKVVIRKNIVAEMFTFEEYKEMKSLEDDVIEMQTLDGTCIATKKHYILLDGGGEYYPIEIETFDKTYDFVELEWNH